MGCLAAAEAAAAAARACCANPTTHPAKDLGLSQYLCVTLNSPPDPKKLNKPLTPDNESAHSMPQRHGAAQQPAWEAGGMQLAGCRATQNNTPTRLALGTQLLWAEPCRVDTLAVAVDAAGAFAGAGCCQQAAAPAAANRLATRCCQQMTQHCFGSPGLNSSSASSSSLRVNSRTVCRCLPSKSVHDTCRASLPESAAGRPPDPCFSMLFAEPEADRRGGTASFRLLSETSLKGPASTALASCTLAFPPAAFDDVFPSVIRPPSQLPDRAAIAI